MASGVSFTEYYNGIDDVARLWIDLFGDQGKDGRCIRIIDGTVMLIQCRMP